MPEVAGYYDALWGYTIPGFYEPGQHGQSNDPGQAWALGGLPAYLGGGTIDLGAGVIPVPVGGFFADPQNPTPAELTYAATVLDADPVQAGYQLPGDVGAPIIYRPPSWYTPTPGSTPGGSLPGSTQYGSFVSDAWNWIKKNFSIHWGSNGGTITVGGVTYDSQDGLTIDHDPEPGWLSAVKTWGPLVLLLLGAYLIWRSSKK